MSGRTLLADSSWAERRWSDGFLIGLTTFGILVLELALIRWTSSQIRIFAYFNNLVLISAFLGMGVGVALGRRRPGLVHLTLPVLLGLALPLAFSESLGLVDMRFPDKAIALWGGEVVPMEGGVFARNVGIFCGLLGLIMVLFACAGAPLGLLFSRGRVLRAYTADLVGSLAGIAAFTLLAWLELGPGWWLGTGVAAFALLTRRPAAAALAVVITLLGQHTATGVHFSPYNRIELVRNERFGLELRVNRDFHQYMFDLSDRRLEEAAGADPVLVELRALYDLPFVLNRQRGSALIVGAGTGNDVQAAVRNGYQEVVSVDIDGRIIALGRAEHPEQPYTRSHVRTVVNDGRAFFSQNTGAQFDVVCFGLLDSHAMSSAMSTLRLDNYVYTEEGIRAAWEHVAPGGHLSLSISCMAGRWFFDRLYWTIAKATGREPIALLSPLHSGTGIFIVTRDQAGLREAELGKWSRVEPLRAREETLTPSDDWPFLYLRPGVFPWGYVAVLGFIVVVAVGAGRPVFGLGRDGAGVDWPLFLMGAAFLLIETRGITSLSLLFGSTWVVNSVVFGGILTMVLIANLAVMRWRWEDPRPWFWLLFGAVGLLYFFPMGWLQAQSLPVRAVLSGLLTGLPVGVAGVIVPILLARSPQPAAALGSNLVGAVLGGVLEYYSMLGGMKATALMALSLYLAAFLVMGGRGRR